MTKRWNIAIQVFLVIVALAGSVYVAFAPANSLINWFNIDDAFYYYKVAQNVLAGHGFTFDGINLSNGFHPLWMVVCLGVFWLSKFSLILPLRVLAVVSGLFNAGTVLILYHLLRKFIHQYAAILGALFWGLFPSIYNVNIVHGMESVVSSFFMVLLLFLAAKYLFNEEKKPVTPLQMIWLGLAGALTALSRLDNVFIVAFIGLFVLFEVRKISSALIYDWVALALALVASWIIRLGTASIEQNMYSIYPMMGIAFLLSPAVYYFFGMYKGFAHRSPISKILRQVGAGVVNFGLMYGTSSLLYRLGILNMFSRSVILFYAMISFLFILCLRIIQQNGDESVVTNPFTQFLYWLKSAWKNILINGVAFSIPIVLIIGTYCLFNKIEFGTLTPVSGQIKTWWGTLSNTVYAHPNTLITILGLSPSSAYGPWGLLTSRIYSFSQSVLRLIHASDSLNSIFYILLMIVVVFLLAMVLKLNKNRLGLKFFSIMGPGLLVGCLFQIAYYTTVGYVATRVWYWVSESLVLTLLLAVLLDGLFSWLSQALGKQQWVNAVLVCLAVAGIVFTHSRFIYSMAPMHVAPDRQQAYRAETAELESLTPPGAKIGMTGGGMVAYFIQDRTIVNLDGLINSNTYFKAMKKGTATQFLDAIPLNYVFGNEYMVLESDPYSEFLKSRLQKVGMIRGEDNFTLYKYVINQ